ncbi:MFS general substrate transporter [Wilcoxina mikolae CBS 423.85]|nr:MFS general substrate transporter [Wilcoxina mikolae CBS 423.85]
MAMASDRVVPPPGKGFKLGPITLPPWLSPMAQMILIGFVCFLCTGGSGQLDSGISAKSMTAIYTTFTIVGFMAGSFLNFFGVKVTLGLGGLEYGVYYGAWLCYDDTQNEGFVIFAGVLLGVCAAFIWCAHGTIMMSYPTEQEKGRYIGLFWSIFNFGAVLGSLVPIVPVNDGTYIGFLVLMVCGGILAWFLVPPEKIIGSDGTRVQHILLLFPYFWASNWFYTYEQNAYNLYMFNTRTRSFTGLWYWLSQIFGSLLFGWFLDNKSWSRRTRAIAGWGVLFIIVNVVWYRGMDVYDRGFAWYCLLYVCYGILDSVWQTYAYWLMGALSNEPRKLHILQAAGSAVAWGLDSARVPYRVLFATSWGLCILGMAFVIPLIWLRINDTEAKELDSVDDSDSEKTDEVALPVSEVKDV